MSLERIMNDIDIATMQLMTPYGKIHETQLLNILEFASVDETQCVCQ